MDVSFNEVGDGMTFYDDGDAAMLMPNALETEEMFSPSPPLGSLLSPENSVQHFRIVNKITPHKSSTLGDNKTLEHQNINDLQNLHKLVSIQEGSMAVGNATAVSSSANSSKTMRTYNSLSSESMDTSMDDDYIEYFEMESFDNPSNESLFKFPSNLNSLICGKIKQETPDLKSNRRLFAEDHNAQNRLKTPEAQKRPSVRRCLSLFEEEDTPPRAKSLFGPQQNTQIQNNTLCSSSINQTYKSPASNAFKRPEVPTNCSPRQAKRYRFSDKENFELDLSASPTTQTFTGPKPATGATQKIGLRKCMSMNDAEIMSALARSESSDEPQLIGDLSGPFILPLIEGRHRDLKSISSDTLAQLINGFYDDKIGSYQIIDCRYPYEYDGGHIRGAINLFTQEQIIAEFLSKKKCGSENDNERSSGDNRHIIIFHCEFSSERGPKLSRFLRNNDRARNTSSYPSLDYPEIYLLHNGYKEFFETHSELCDPASYRPMLEPSYNEAYRHFRAKSKSWNGADGLAGATTRKKLYAEGRSLLQRL